MAVEAIVDNAAFCAPNRLPPRLCRRHRVQFLFPKIERILMFRTCPGVYIFIYPDWLILCDDVGFLGFTVGGYNSGEHNRRVSL